MVYNIEIHNSSSGAGILYAKTIDETSNMEWRNVSCISTFASLGSCIYHLSVISFSINELRINENGLYPIFLQWSFLITISIINLQITNSSIQSNLIFCSSVNLELKSVHVNNLKSPASLIFTQSSILNVKEAHFANVTQLLIIETENTNFTLEKIKLLNPIDLKISFLKSISSIGLIIDCNLSKISSSEDQLIFFSNGNLTINRMQFFDNMGRFIRLFKSNFIFTESFVKNNTSIDELDGNDILFLHEFNELFHVRIERIVFASYKNISCNLNGFISIFILNCSFQNFRDLSDENQVSTAILALNFNDMNINSCSFINFTNGALSIQININFFGRISNLEILNSNFTENTAPLGGAIFISGSAKLKLASNIFEKNQAIIKKKSDNDMQGIGGCIFFSTSNFSNENFILASNVFRHSYAANHISTIFSQAKITTDSNNIFDLNNDNLNFVSFPLQTQLSISTNKSSIINIVSGAKFDLKLEMIDSGNEFVYFDNSSIFTMKVLQKHEGNTIFMENTLGKAEQGIISFTNVKIKTNSKSNFTLLITGSFKGLKSTSIYQQVIENQYNFFARECRIGEIILSDLTCMKCPKGEYSLIDPMSIDIKYQKCNKCPENSDCPGGYLIYPKPGFYRKTNYSTNVIACINQEACLGGIPLANSSSSKLEANINGICLEGNSGGLCFYCDFGYGRYAKIDYCKQCANINIQVFFRIAVYGLFMIAYILMNTHFAEKFSKDSQKSAENKNMISTFMKMLVNHSQQISVILLSTEFPIPNVNSLFEASDYASFSDTNAISNDCVIQLIFFDKKSFSILKEIFSMVLPIVFSLVSFSIWLLVNWLLSKTNKFKNLKNKLPKTFHQLFQKLTLFLLISAFIFYALILKSCFNLFNCLKLDANETKTYLRFSPDMQCWESDHTSFIMFLGMPGIIIWGLSFPLFLGAILRRNFLQNMLIKKHGLEKIEEKHDNFRNFWVKGLVRTLATNKLNLKEKKALSNQYSMTERKTERFITIKQVKKDGDDANEVKEERLNEKEEPHYQEIKREFQAANLKKIADNNNSSDQNRLFSRIDLKNSSQVNNPIESKEKFEPNKEENSQNSRDQIIKLSSHEIQQVVVGLKITKKFKTETEKENYAFKTLDYIQSGKIFIFFYKDFKNSFYYWESLIFFRKFIITFIATLDETIPEEPKTLLITLFLGFYINFTVNKWPYKFDICNRLELLSLATLAISSLSIFIFNSNSNDAFKKFAGVISLLSNAGFYGILCYLVIVNFLQNMKENGKKLMKTLTRGEKR